jgi:threonine/homoserine/homoserine lactone efflux protein
MEIKNGLSDKNKFDFFGFKIFGNGLMTGLFLQFAIGPVFFYIVNLTLQRSIYDGLVAVLAVTLVDYFYITLSIVGVGKLLEKKEINKVFGIVSSLVLVAFGVWIIYGISNSVASTTRINSISLIASFLSVFFLTISSPMTIVFFTGIFTAKAVEYNYAKKELWIFGLAVGSATFLFMGLSVIIFSLLRQTVPMALIQLLNLIVGVVLVGYGVMRIIKILKLGVNNLAQRGDTFAPYETRNIQTTF